MTDLQKRGPGRPKRTKNKPGARAGRPRKDDLNVQQKEIHAQVSFQFKTNFALQHSPLSFSRIPQQETGSLVPPHRHAAKAGESS